MANFTKQAIKASFLKLLNQQPLNKISVRDIVEDCGINRNSFYYHFRDIPSLLGEIVADQTEQLIRAYPSISSLDECFHVAFRFALENKRAVMHIYLSVNRDVFTQSMLKLCEPRCDLHYHRVPRRSHQRERPQRCDPVHEVPAAGHVLRLDRPGYDRRRL